jgi:hypothetical protein
MTTAVDHQIGCNSADWTAPFHFVATVTPNDGADLAFVTRAIRANVAGTIKVALYTDQTDAAPVTMNFAAGETRSVRATRIYATGTTATGIEAMA